MKWLCRLPFRWEYFGTRRICRWCKKSELMRYSYGSGVTFWSEEIKS